MTKVSIVIEDLPDGETDIKIHFDPPVDPKSQREMTEAEYLALRLIQTIKNENEVIEMKKS